MWPPAAPAAAHEPAVVTTGRRSFAKAVTYRLVVMCADAAAIYLLTGQWRLAAGFMVASNVYTTVLYFLHERLWARIRWGRTAPDEQKGQDPRPDDMQGVPWIPALGLRVPGPHRRSSVMPGPP